MGADLSKIKSLRTHLFQLLGFSIDDKIGIDSGGFSIGLNEKTFLVNVKSYKLEVLNHSARWGLNIIHPVVYGFWIIKFIINLIIMSIGFASLSIGQYQYNNSYLPVI